MPLWMVAGKPQPTGPFHWKRDQRLEGVRHGGQGGRLRRGDAVALANQFASLGVHQATLDPGPPISTPNICIRIFLFGADGQWSTEHEKMAVIREAVRSIMRDPAGLFRCSGSANESFVLLLARWPGARAHFDVQPPWARRREAPA